ncbi:LPS export ABC transporter periplasmic protein LptC [Sphingomonas desiccabilis]|uniref:LPS export ABC transporter periplasmic protein LptC n=1 Tax=Sphingomonas desiccabilis TaxID=429134 RepID=A0A4Q2ITQ5_9SPHN|nr:LPS export ABC transporter periplasmic protein LptC [Sphingomonas desiccabilis]MBB3911704.1 lipopolysaccharide export system protein LptC [Sphingomonas desiccabilis]RXZ31569.1 LPS export ABC transporter periplasmic protein LptC [Sphingomonas desiccabilis]
MSEIARRERTHRQHWALPGGRHDRLIRLSLVALPVAIGVLAAFLVLAPLFMRGDVSFVLDKNKVEVAKERLRLQTARYTGADAKGQPFALTAGSAVQKSSSEPIVQLDKLAAEIQLKDGPARLNADHGRYDLDSEQVAIDGPIAFRAADGYRLDTRDATVDLKTRKLRSGGAADGTTPLGTFSGDRLSADLEARTVRLDGNARLRIQPGRTK